MLSSEIPFTDATDECSPDEYNSLLATAQRYENALRLIEGLADYEGSRAVRLASEALANA